MKKKYTKSTQCATYLDFIQSVERKVHKKYTWLYFAKILESLLPDVVHLHSLDIDIAIPEKWKSFQGK